MFGGFQVGPFQPLPAFQQVAPVTTGIPPGGAGWPVDWQGKRRKRRLSDQPNKHLDIILDKVVAELYGEVSEDAPAEVQREAAKIVKPFVEGKAKGIPPEAAIDWQAFAEDRQRVNQLWELYRQYVRNLELDDDDEYMLLMDD